MRETERNGMIMGSRRHVPHDTILALNPQTPTKNYHMLTRRQAVISCTYIVLLDFNLFYSSYLTVKKCLDLQSSRRHLRVFCKKHSTLFGVVPDWVKFCICLVVMYFFSYSKQAGLPQRRRVVRSQPNYSAEPKHPPATNHDFNVFLMRTGSWPRRDA